MNVLKLGLTGFFITVLISIGIYAISDGRSELFNFNIAIMGHIMLLLLWYILIKISMTDSLKSSILVAMFYIIPYTVLVLMALSVMQSIELKDIYYSLIYVILIKPFFLPSFIHNNYILIYIYQIFNIAILLYINIMYNNISTK